MNDAPEKTAVALTAPQKQKMRTDALVQAVQDKSKEFSTLLEDSGITMAKFVEVFRRALVQSPDLLQADTGSLIHACMNACVDGLLPDGRQGAIVIYNVRVKQRGAPDAWVKKAQWIPMFQGLLDIAYRSGNFKSIQARVVYEGDEFDYSLGITPTITHKPARRPAQGDNPSVTARPIVASYAVALTVNGGVYVEVFEGDDIRKVNAVSRATNGPGKSWPEEFAKKGPLRRLWKVLPRDDRMNRITEHDDDNYDLDALDVPAAPPKSLKVGFGAPAIEHTPAQTADIPMEQVRDEEPEGEFVEDARFHATESAGPMYAGEPGDFPPEADTLSPRIREFADRVAAAQSWLNIKQALRGLLKAQDWDRGADERLALSIAWDRFTELGDKTDFVTDVFLYACWLAGRTPEPSPDEVTGNLKVLQTQADWNRAGDDIQAWVLRAATGRHQS